MSLTLQKHARQLRLLAVTGILLVGSACASSAGFGPSVTGLAELEKNSAAPATLAVCPSSPNCVSSVATNPKKWVEPFGLAGKDRKAFQAQLVLAIEADGGVVKDEREGYVWATYTSSVFRFVDDIEWLFNAGTNAFDVRSASRVGHSDFGVNAKRVARLLNGLNP